MSSSSRSLRAPGPVRTLRTSASRLEIRDPIIVKATGMSVATASPVRTIALVSVLIVPGLLLSVAVGAVEGPVHRGGGSGCRERSCT